MSKCITYKFNPKNSAESLKNYLVAADIIDKFNNIKDINEFRRAIKWSNKFANREGFFDKDFLIEDNNKVRFYIPNFKKLDGIREYKRKQEAKNKQLDLSFSLDSPDVDYQLKAVNILQSDKAKQVFDKGKKANWDLNKILTELAIPKEQKQLILDLGITDREQLALELASNYSYTVEINTAIDKESTWDMRAEPTNAKYYSNLTVPGGTNYTENEISTPLITPSIKGHAQFSTDKGIGWFRSDEQLSENDKIDEEVNKDLSFDDALEGDMEAINKFLSKKSGEGSKTRRILEVQSDLFQKGRDKENLINTRQDPNEVFNPKKAKKQINSFENQFLQLLNKDNNWVTFFVKSIIQDSAKKGYEKVLFPSGNTASKVEGHTTLEEFKKQKEDRIKDLEYLKQQIKKDILETPFEIIDSDQFAIGDKFKTEKETINFIEENDDLNIRYRERVVENEFKYTSAEKEITQLQQELERIEKEGFGALKPIYNFYENTVKNILKKTYKVNQVTDEYSNTWNEIVVDNINTDILLSLDSPEEDQDIRFIKELQRLTNLKKTISEQLKKNISITRKETLLNQLKQLNNDIKILNNIENQTLNGLISLAKNHIKRAVDLLDKNEGDYKIVSALIVPYLEIFSKFETTDEAIMASIIEIKTDINSIINQINDSNKYRVADLVLDETGIDILDDAGNMKVFKDSGLLGSNILSSSVSINTIIQAADKMIKRAVSKINDAFSQFLRTFNNIKKDFEEFQKAAGLSKNNYYDYMLQEVNGKRNGLFVTRLSSEYNELKREARKKGVKEYGEFIAKNNDISINVEKWENHKKIIEERNVMSTGSADNEDKRQQYIANILAQHNPERALMILNKLKDGKNVSSLELQFLANFNSKNYWWLLNIKASDKFIDKKWKAIQALDDNDPRKKFYNYFTDTIYKGRNILGEHHTVTRVPINYIPEIEEISPFYKDVSYKMKKSLTNTNKTNMITRDPVTGEELPIIPLYTLSNRLKADEKSYDLAAVLEKFQSEVLNKEYKEEIEDNALMMQNVVRHLEFYQQDTKGDIVKDKFGPIIVKNPDSNAYKQIKYLVDATLYDKYQAIETSLGGKLRTKAQEARLKELNEKYNSPEDIDALIKEYKEEEKDTVELLELKELTENYRTYTADKVANGLIKATVIKALGFNIFGGIAEVIQGSMALLSESAGAEFFGDKALSTAYGTMFKYFRPGASTEKIDALLTELHILESYAEGSAKDNKFDNIAFYSYRMSDKLNRGVTMLAYLEEQFGIKNIDIDANGFITGIPGLTEVVDGKTRYTEKKFEIESAIKHIIATIHSRDNSTDPIRLNKTSVGRLIGQFRQSWMFQGVYRRFGAEQDIALLKGKKIKGFYRSVFYNDATKSLDFKRGMMLLYHHLTNKKKLDQLSPVDKANVAKMFRELVFITLSFGLYLALSKLAPDDDEDKTVLWAWLENQTYRANRDLSFYLSPTSATEVTGNIIPAMKTINDLWAVQEALVQTMIGNPYSYEGTAREELKLWKAIKKNIFVLNQAEKQYMYFFEDAYRN